MGVYDLAIGSSIISAFAGPADANSFELVNQAPKEHTPKVEKSEDILILEGLYQEIRNMRVNYVWNKERVEEIKKILKTNYINDWLLNQEILEFK